MIPFFFFNFFGLPKGEREGSIPLCACFFLMKEVRGNRKKQHEIFFFSFPLLILGLDSSERLDVFK